MSADRLITRVGTVELRVPQDRQALFSTEVFVATRSRSRGSETPESRHFSSRVDAGC